MNPDELQQLSDDKGFLADWRGWNTEIALAFAALENIELTNNHWEIIYLLREFYVEYDTSPANRALTNYTRKRLGDEKGRSIYLMSLFPGSPARVGSRIAGLPKPKNCL